MSVRRNIERTEFLVLLKGHNDLLGNGREERVSKERVVEKTEDFVEGTEAPVDGSSSSTCSTSSKRSQRGGRPPSQPPTQTICIFR